MMQGKSSKTLKGPSLNERDPRVAKFNSLDPMLNDLPLSALSYGTSLDQNDDTTPSLSCYPNDFPCSKDFSSETGPNMLRISENCPLPRSKYSDITQCQSGEAKNSTASKLHKFGDGQLSNSSNLVNFSYFPRFTSVPGANNVKHDGKNDTFVDQSLDKAVASGAKAHELAMAKSSICSANRCDRASDDLAFRLKRKSPKTRDSESCRDEVEEESIAFKKTNRGRESSKKSRASEVHNLSERRRRERINEKMRALQELLPNCNKVDKASMLDEAIEYLKTLQLQLQAFSTGAGMCMSSMMSPETVGAMHRAHAPQFLSAGIGPCYPVGQVATSSTFHGAEGSSHRGLAHHTQEIPISSPYAPLPFSESPHISFPGAVHLPLLVPSATSRDVVENIGSRAMPNDHSSNKTS